MIPIGYGHMSGVDQGEMHRLCEHDCAGFTNYPRADAEWRRYKGFRRGQFAEGAAPALTYNRSSVEVAVKLTTPEDAHEEELRLIRRLQPRDNQLGQPEPEPELEEALF